MKKILENGTEVLIFEHISELRLDQDMKHYIRGIVIKSEMSDDLSYHGSPWNIVNYTVLGEDGIKYFGNYGHHTVGGSFFMTEEDYVCYLNRKIEINKEKIIEIENENNKLEEIIKNTKTKGKQKVLSRK